MENHYALCMEAEELVAHLFISCTVSHSIWCYFSYYFDVDYLAEPTIECRIKLKPSISLIRLGRRYWESSVHAISWVIWVEINNQIFECKKGDENQTIVDIKLLI